MNAPERPMGVIHNMPAEDYFAAPGLSYSGMKHLLRSPWHYRNRADKAPTRNMLCGTLAHCAVLEPDAMAARYIVVPEDAPRRPTAAQWNAKKPSADSQAAMAWWRDFNDRAAGREIVTAEEYATTQAQLQAVLAVPELAALLAHGHAEASVFWVDGSTGVYCKARPDWVHPLGDNRVILLDLKSTADESPSAFARATFNFGYDMQDAHYCAGYEAATGQQVVAFIFAAVTSAAPVLAVPYMLDDDAKAYGARRRAQLLQLYAECRASGQWPAYGSGVQSLSLPRWAQ